MDVVELKFDEKPQERVSRIEICRPQALNALNGDVLRALFLALDAIEKKQSVVCVLSGAGQKAFVAGADIKEMQEMSSAEAEKFSEMGQRLSRRMAEMDCIFIAAVEGFALGGGCELALACDLTYANASAKFGQPEVSLGVIAGFGGTQRLLRLLGKKRAGELLYTGMILGAQEAKDIGMINDVFQDDAFDSVLQARIEKLTKNSPEALRRTKKALRLGEDISLERALAMEAQQFALCFDTFEQKEGMRAFVEKRKPNFNGEQEL